jgi:transposase
VHFNLCESCLEKQRTIDRLKQEIQSLREKVHRLERKAEAGPFGSSTPSAKIPRKANTAEEQRSKPGGAQPGHAGHGRKAVEDSDAGRIETIAAGPACPYCGGPLEHKEYRDRSVIDSQPLRAEPILYQLERARCPRCGKTVQARAPEVLPKSLYGNQLITQVVFLHYRQGIPMGRLCDQLGIGLGAVFEILHRMAALFRGVMGKLIEQYRQAPVRHADETGWRTDGRSGYAWLFASATVSLFLFRATRSAQVPKEVLGESALDGVLVVDRYNAYNRSPCALQYCYAHLLRDVEDLAKEFPGEAEVTGFTSTLIPLLAEAMHLRGRPLADAGYYDQARPLQQQTRGSGGATRPTLGCPPGTGHLPRPRPSSVPLGEKPRGAGRQQPGRAGTASNGHRPQGELRVAIRRRRENARGPDERGSHAGQAVCRPGSTLQVGARPTRGRSHPRLRRTAAGYQLK